MLGYSRDGYVGRPIAEYHADEAVMDDILNRLRTGDKPNEYPAVELWGVTLYRISAYNILEARQLEDKGASRHSPGNPPVAPPRIGL